MQSQLQSSQRRPKTNSPTSRYRFIPTENIKFEKFMTLIFKSKMRPEEIRDEIMKYVQAIETNYNETIRMLKDEIGREKNKFKKVAFEKV